MVSVSFNSRFTVEFLCSVVATQVVVTTVRFPYCFIIRKKKKNTKSFQPFLSRWTDFKISINGSRVKSLYRYDDTTLTGRK